MSLPVHFNRESSSINAFNLQKNNQLYHLHTEIQWFPCTHKRISCCHSETAKLIIHVGGCPAHTLKNKSYETVAIVTHKHLLNKQWRTNSCHGCKGEQATGNLFSLFLYQMFCRFVQTKDDFSLKINYHLLQKEVSKILLFSKQDYFIVQ